MVRGVALVVVVLAAACGGRARPAAPASAPASAPLGCTPAAGSERLVIAEGATVTTASGLEITFASAGHDQFGDGRFDAWVALRFRRGAEEEARMPSLLAPHPGDALLGHCWRLVDGGEAQVELEVAPL